MSALGKLMLLKIRLMTWTQLLPISVSTFLLYGIGDLRTARSSASQYITASI